MSVDITETNSLPPDYILTFIKNNIQNLEAIYNEGVTNMGEGILYCICSEKDNTIEVKYISNDDLYKIIPEKQWVNFKSTNDINTKYIYIYDLDIQTNFILHI